MLFMCLSYHQCVNCLEFMDRAVGLRELPNVTVLDQIEVKNDHLLVVLSGNPFIDAMESEKQRKKKDSWYLEQQSILHIPLFYSCCMICIS